MSTRTGTGRSKSPLLGYLLLTGLLWAQRVSSDPPPTARPQQIFAIEPADRTAIVGAKVVLPCRVLNKVGTLQWTRDGFGLGSDRELRGFPRYTMVGSDEEGDFSLQITNVNLDDDAVFQCQVGAAEGVKGIRSRNGIFTVYVPPEPPHIVQGDFLRTTAGMTVELTCESHAGKPPAELTWLDGDGNMVTGNIEYTTQTLSDGKRANAALKWTLVPSREHDGKTFTCRSENPALKQPLYASMKMEVKYAPEITLHVNQEKITELENVKFTCDAVANPADVVYKWYRNDEVVVGDQNTVYVIPRITRDFNGDTISCEVSNSVGTSKSTHTLNVYYGPVFKSSFENIAVDIGSDIHLKCDVDGNPTPEIIWTFEGSPTVLSTQQELIIKSATIKDAGKYTCRASGKGFAEISGDVMVFIKGAPKVISESIQYGVKGELVKVECLVESVPPPTRITWSKNSQHLDIDNNEGYEIVEEPQPDGVKNMLVIHNAEDDHFGQYNCSVWNEFGHDSLLITVRKQKSLPMLIILSGVIGGIVLIVSVTIIIILCLKRKSVVKDEDFGSEKKAKQSDSASSGDSDLKAEIRTASSLSNNEHERSWEETSDTTRTHDTQDIYKYSADYAEPTFPPKADTQSNNGYIPYVDYSRDYNPPSVHLNASRDSGLYGSSPQSLDELGHSIDPRYRASYANPYLRTSQSNLPPPQGVYVTTWSGSPTTPGPNTTQNRYITAQHSQTHLKPGTLATHV
ncbi:irregular chiasm C-roughest protein-like isoform X2 [Centruroides sculpturatus]|uniref:irregular chiasm C-roughest protein-like isoform X2 n=1 Tax=Centruroides sculpturatus TaxID=218467 RepID=UPI000C6EAD9E|nr:irregular chiasm C-roughest protein-like isoform X2 [Centruroides sculpturatus]